MSNEVKYKEILASRAKRICVIAGPGSGKTKGILIPKADQLVSNGTEPSDILLLSFSRLSAIDLKRRVKGKKIKASTVHSFCLSFLLSENNHAIRERIESIVLQFEEQFLIADLRLVLPEIKTRVLSDMLGEFSAGWATSPHDEVFEKTEEQRRFKAAVVNWLIEHKAALLGEIVYFALDLMKKIGVTDFLGKHKYILIDEYQDLNKLEQEFVIQFSESGDLLLIVGDPDQSIYSFKFAHPTGILDAKNKSESHFLEYCGRCGTRILNVANQLLVQDSPGRKELPKPLADQEEGKVSIPKHFDTQAEEFTAVRSAIIKKLKSGVNAENIIVLVPKKKLGQEFVRGATPEEQEALKHLGAEVAVVSKSTFSEVEKKQILLFSLVANPKSILHLRAYLGLGEDNTFAPEFAEIKKQYGDILTFMEKANPDDFGRKKRVKRLCEKALELRQMLRDIESKNPDEIINVIFPTKNEELCWINEVLIALKEEDDTVASLFSKFSDYMRSAPDKPNTVRVMTIMESKGLEADHVYIVGCNSGNLPGQNRSVHLSDAEHIREQRRVLYVGMTRAKKFLAVTWSRHIPFEQSLSNYTKGVGVIRRGSQVLAKVAICDFLEDLKIS